MIADLNLTDTLAFVAAITGLGAFWVAWREVCRSNKVKVKLKKFSSQYTTTAAGDPHHELEVWVLNRGIQLQNISLGLGFYGPDMCGYCRLTIPLSDQSKEAASTFLRGTIARFVLSSADQNALQFLPLLRDIKDQRPKIILYNSSFVACSFPTYSRWDLFKKLWNRLSWRFTFRRRVGDGPEGKGVFKYYQLPHFVIRSEILGFFLSGLNKADKPDRDFEPPSEARV